MYIIEKGNYMANEFGNSLSTADMQIRILKSLRRIMRAVDIHSKQLNKDFKVTAPQMICLMSLDEKEASTLSELSKSVSLSPSTLTKIIDRLEEKKLIKRERDLKDRRKFHIKVTEQGKHVISDSPALLQDKLSLSVAKLPSLEQATIALALEKLVSMMDLEGLDASPYLFPGNKIQEINNEL